MGDNSGARPSALWARLRFSIVGPLLACPPEAGELKEQLQELANKSWRHPTTRESVRFGFSTIERWYYTALEAPRDPVGALERKLRAGAGEQPSISEETAALIESSYKEHPTWSYMLHFDNVVAALADPDSAPSYATVCRYMKRRAMVKLRKRRNRRGHEPAVARERRSFEVRNVHAMWHLDFHECSRRVLTRRGDWIRPKACGVLDDRSRLACHLQWYEAETAENLCHGLSQAIQKRGLPRSLLTDNGSAMIAAETEQGLERLGITHWTTLPETPEQNAKQESFWGPVEGRLMAMLEGLKDLTLERLNQATQAWVEMEYNRRRHSEIGMPPTECLLREPNVARPSPSSSELRGAFRIEQTRAQRRSDGTVSIEGKRFEIPSRYRAILRPTLRYARWDLSRATLVDGRTGAALAEIYPLDKQANASGRRAALVPVEHVHEVAERPVSGEAPLLKQLMAEYAASGLPPAYLSKEAEENEDE